jgi:hypothetical protein
MWLIFLDNILDNVHSRMHSLAADHISVPLQLLNHLSPNQYLWHGTWKLLGAFSTKG